MKFAQEFKRSLQREGFPQRWIDSAIPYGQLKKCLKKVTNELHELGLDKETLAQLAASEPQSPDDIRFQYNLDGETGNPKHIRPRLTVFVHLEDGVAIDAKLTPATREFLEKMAARKAGVDGGPAESPASRLDDIPPVFGDGVVSSLDPHDGELVSSSIQQVEVPLIFDGEFFDILQTDVSNLDALQEEEERNLKSEITGLGQTIATVTNPSGRKAAKAKEDKAKWRQIFELYLDARIFFSKRESDHGMKTSAQALEQLQWFQNEVLERQLVQTLQLPASREAFNKFLAINSLLLQNLKFQEINQLAVTKILKKFDKRTSLGVAKTFPVAVRSDHLLAGSMARDLCAQVSSEIISVVPQLDDYLCPICLTVAYWPIRLECQHIFCSRCMVKMQRKEDACCPLCRNNVIMKATLENLDEKHAKFLKTHFPKEVKEKLRASELESGREMFGPDYVSRPCTVM